MCDHTSGSDDDVVPYGNPRKDLNSRTEPDIITNRYWFIEHKPAIPLIRKQGMASGMEAATAAQNPPLMKFRLPNRMFATEK